MKRIKKMLHILFFIALTAGIAAGIGVAAVNLHMINQTKNRIAPADAMGDFSPDCILVLGAGVRADGTPSHMLEDRLLTAISLYDAAVSPKLLMSGDHGRSDYDEVNTMKAFAIDKGIPSEDIFMDHAGFSTYDSLYRAKEVFGAEKIVIVTQGYHLYRALYIAQALGLEAVGVSADLRSYSGQSMRDLRELLARTKDFAYTLTKPLPTYLGDPISLQGSGDVTNDK